MAPCAVADKTKTRPAFFVRPSIQRPVPARPMREQMGYTFFLSLTACACPRFTVRLESPRNLHCLSWALVSHPQRVAMRRQLRVFREDFLKHMHAAGAWPSDKVYRAWARGTSFDGIRSGTCRTLGGGGPSSQKHVTKLVAYFRQPGNQALRQALTDYFLDRGISYESLHLESTFDLVSEPANATFSDAFMAGLGLVRNIFEKVRHPESCVELLEHPNDVHQVVRWLFVEAGRQLSKRSLPQQSAIAKAEQAMQTSLAKYQSLAVSSWRTEPWTVIGAMGYRKRAGMSIALPVLPEAYERVLRGDCKSYTCMESDITSRSPCVIVEGMAMRPTEEGVEAEGTTLCLVAAMLCQQAHLSDVPGVAREVPLRLLAPAGPSKNRKRAMRFGYKPTGTFLHGTEVEFLERTLLVTGRPPFEWCIRGIWRGLQHATRSFPRPVNRPSSSS